MAGPHGTKSAHEVLNVREEMLRRQSRLSAVIGRIGEALARPAFFAGLLAAHLGWVVLNLPGLPWQPWDPYPFTFLATIASAEAPFITLLILMNQARNRRIAELREETNLQISLHIEREVTMALRLLGGLQRHLAVPLNEDPKRLEEMQENLDPEVLLDHLRKHLREEEGSDDTGRS